MSESVLKAILQLFAIVVRVDDVSKQEREQVRIFLDDHLSKSLVPRYVDFFDSYLIKLGDSISKSGEEKVVGEVCKAIEEELTQKQKVVIVFELIRIILADGKIHPKEDILVNQIATNFKITTETIDSFKSFVLGEAITTIDRSDVLVISNEQSPTNTSTNHLYRKHLKGFLAILYIQHVELYFVKYEGSGDIYLNGVPVKSGSISILAVGSTLKWDKDEPVYFGDILSKFKVQSDYPRITLNASNISFSFKSGKLGLRNINLAEESGNLIALMGSSGAGKSTLLNVLNGIEKPSSGAVLINGIDIHRSPDKIEGVFGFVPQDDLLIEDLTVFENLYYAAKLCFNDKSNEEIHALVIKVLEDLGLEETKDLKVGSPLRKTISGGQRKRLNIGLELLREPAVLFCDEPTSGLSSRDSENIIDLLKELSLKGKLVFAVIHQPSSDIFKMFDKLLILDSGGYQIYYGNPIDAIVYFKKSIELINSSVGECHDCGNVNPEQIFNIIETKVINEYGHFTNERKFTAEQWNEIFVKNFALKPVEEETAKPESSLQIPPRLKQMQLFSLRDIKAKIHNRQYMIINLLEAPVLAIILAFIVRYYNVDDKMLGGYLFGKNPNIPAYLFISVIVALFMGLTVSAEEIIRDRKILKREAFLHLSRSSYVMSKLVILFSLSAIQTLSFVLIGSMILKIEGLILQHWLILFTTSCFANLLGLNISSAFNSAVTIYILIPLLIIPQLILSGVVVKFDKLNPTIGNTATVPFVGDLMASRWAFEAAMVTQFKDNLFEKEFYMYDKVMANSDYKKVYYIPEIETRLQYSLNNFKSDDPEIKEKVTADLLLINKELHREVVEVGLEPIDHLQNLTIDKFDSATYQQVIAFLETLKRVYINRYNKADREKERLVISMTDTPEKAKTFERYRERYHNDAIADLTKNMSELHRIIEKDGKLIQKIYPIYKNPDPEHTVDFDAQFYMPAKHFLSRNIDTLFFNIGVIWSMCLFLLITLYFDVLRRIIDGIGNLSNPLYK